MKVWLKRFVSKKKKKGLEAQSKVKEAYTAAKNECAVISIGSLAPKRQN